MRRDDDAPARWVYYMIKGLIEYTVCAVVRYTTLCGEKGVVDSTEGERVSRIKTSHELTTKYFKLVSFSCESHARAWCEALAIRLYIFNYTSYVYMCVYVSYIITHVIRFFILNSPSWFLRVIMDLIHYSYVMELLMNEIIKLYVYNIY